MHRGVVKTSQKLKNSVDIILTIENTYLLAYGFVVMDEVFKGFVIGEDIFEEAVIGVEEYIM